MELDISARVELLEEKIEAACRRSGRKREEISLMGVTKLCPLEKIEAAWKAGIRLFGESRVLEAAGKFEKFFENHARGEDLKLHLIGSLQRNKAKTAAAFFDCIQSVDRVSLITELGALCEGREKPLNILLEYHTGEETKAGFPDFDSLVMAAEKVLSFRGLRPLGLMTMAPFTSDSAQIRSSFRKLKNAAMELEKRFPEEKSFKGNFSSGAKHSWSCLSMGMTNDYEIAIEEGSTLIRIGTALFGEGGI